jgi:hypothetical protein
MPKVDKSCVSCGEIGKYRRVNEKYICDECNEKDEFKYISKSTVLKKYHLTQSDIDNVDYKLVNNPHYKCAPEMMLYKLTDILDVFNKKYDNPPDIDLYIEKLNEEKEERKERKRLKREDKQDKILSDPNYIDKLKNKKKLTKQERTFLLENELNKYNLTIRADSYLCNEYIKGSNCYSLEQISKRMCEMKYLYDYLNVRKYYETAKKKSQHWEYDTVPLIDIMEECALEEHGPYPPVWPWLKKKKVLVKN